MTLSLTFACCWAVIASVIAFLPSKRNHWPQAVALIGVGIPLLGYVTYENGPTAGVICLVAGGSILRWPLAYAFGWVRRKAGPGAGGPDTRTPGAEARDGGAEDAPPAPARAPD